MAALAGRVDAVTLLCERGTSVAARNLKDETPLALAVNSASAGAHAAAAVLVRHGALTTEGARSREISGVLLHAACASATPASGALLQLLIDNGLDITVPQDGQSALHTAAFNTNLPAVKVLVAAGLDVRSSALFCFLKSCLLTMNGSLGGGRSMRKTTTAKPHSFTRTWPGARSLSNTSGNTGPTKKTTTPQPVSRN